MIVQRKQCIKINSIGQQCAHVAMNGSDMCAFHDTSRRRRCLAITEKTGKQCNAVPLVGQNVCAHHLQHAKRFRGVTQVIEKKPDFPDTVPFDELPPESTEPDPIQQFLEITDSKEFVKAILDSRLFKEYIVDGLRARTIPPTVLMRLMDEGWGKPVDRVEHTGKDGQPIETISEVRMVVVKPKTLELHDETIDALPVVNESRH